MSPQRYNRTNFMTSEVARKIIAAMQGALNDGLQHYIENRLGQRWLRVCVRPVEGSEGHYTFAFHAGNGQDVGHLILQALFSWSHDLEHSFSLLLGELYARKVHPYTTARQQKELDIRREEEATFKFRLRAVGATESFRTLEGATVYGKMVRRWYAPSYFLVLADGRGRLYKKGVKIKGDAFQLGCYQGAADVYRA